MNQQPDKFFRDKLEHYQKPAPSTVWGKIAATQTKKNNKVLWLKIAASILLLAVAGYVLWPEETTIGQQQSQLSKVQPIQEEPDSITQNTTEEKITKPESLDNDGKNSQVETETTKERTAPERNTQAKNYMAEKTSTLAVTEEHQNESVLSDNIVIDTPLTDSAQTIIAEVKSNKENQIQNITLVYSAKEVDEYLNKDALAEATSSDKKSSTLKKLLHKANDLKNNQDPFGELRQKKNEILALNFKNEKRGQNK